ncbi:MAG: ATP synthase F1 subunit epsilon [Phycisphaerae bacterium]|jgi:F-type H+-transporting ATPase subunit epsilon
MATATLHCSVITPEAAVYEGPVESVVLPAHDGEIGILVDRAPLMCKLGAGRLRVRTAGPAEEAWFIDGGFAQVVDNRVVVLTQKAIRPDRIDRAAAQAQLAAAQAQLAAARALPARDDAEYKRKAAAEAGARAQLRAAGG